MPHADRRRRDLILRDGAPRLLSMRLQRLCPHAEERRSRVSKYEVARFWVRILPLPRAGTDVGRGHPSRRACGPPQDKAGAGPRTARTISLEGRPCNPYHRQCRRAAPGPPPGVFVLAGAASGGPAVSRPIHIEDTPHGTTEQAHGRAREAVSRGARPRGERRRRRRRGGDLPRLRLPVARRRRRLRRALGRRLRGRHRYAGGRGAAPRRAGYRDAGLLCRQEDRRDPPVFRCAADVPAARPPAGEIPRAPDIGLRKHGHRPDRDRLCRTIRT